jgi:hypothetical protein
MLYDGSTRLGYVALYVKANVMELILSYVRIWYFFAAYVGC